MYNRESVRICNIEGACANIHTVCARMYNRWCGRSNGYTVDEWGVWAIDTKRLIVGLRFRCTSNSDSALRDQPPPALTSDLQQKGYECTIVPFEISRPADFKRAQMASSAALTYCPSKSVTSGVNLKRKRKQA